MFEVGGVGWGDIPVSSMVCSSWSSALPCPSLHFSCGCWVQSMPHLQGSSCWRGLLVHVMWQAGIEPGDVVVVVGLELMLGRVCHHQRWQWRVLASRWSSHWGCWGTWQWAMGIVIWMVVVGVLGLVNNGDVAMGE